MCSGPAERNKLILDFRQEGQWRGDGYLGLTDHPGRGPGHEPAWRSSTRGRSPSDVRPASDVCLPGGRFSAERMTAVLVERAGHSAESGSPLLRVMVEMGWLPGQSETFNVLELYENAVDQVVDRVAAVVLCVYDLHQLNAATLTTVLAAHQTVLLDHTVLVNPHFRTDESRHGFAGGRGPHAQQTSTRERWRTLTHSELRVAAHVADGLTNREMAAVLLVSRHTIDAHLKHIFIKLDIHTRVELTVITLRHRSP
nr:MEDS domain-containing protein [Georgenia muralis]